MTYRPGIINAIRHIEIDVLKAKFWGVSAILSCLLSLTLSNPGYCGGGPEKTLLVVNADSPLSLTVANEYVSLRKIPSNHVVWLRNIPSLTSIDIDTFRKIIWAPIQNFLYEHDLEDDIDIITYSADFPYAIDFDKDLIPYNIKLKPPLSRMASLTGLTFFAHRVEAKNITYLAPQANRYFRFDRSNVAANLKPWTEEEKQFLNDGNQALKEKDFIHAQQAFSKYLHTRPFHAAAWYKLALSYIHQDKTEAAFGALQKASDRGYAFVLKIDNDSAWDKVRNHDEFNRIVKKMRNSNAGFLPPLGFKHQHYTWNSAFSPHAGMRHNYLDRYFLSTMLAYTGIRGNNLKEIKRYLQSAASSDGRQPRGTVYFMENSNVRSTTRQPYFVPAVTSLTEMSHNAEILSNRQHKQNGILPIGRHDVIGVMAGSTQYKWVKSGSQFLPGAIAETLTSYGAMFANPIQTKLSEFLRYGASASSGAVAEPYAVQEKFPTAFLHVFYAAGCSLVESFYQSVSSPYQLLIVGDPLARPFAHFVNIRLDSSKLTNLAGTVEINSEIDSTHGYPLEHVEYWVDGRIKRHTNPKDPFYMATELLANGYHEMRVVTEASGPIATRSFALYPFTTDNTPFVSTIDRYDKQIRLDQSLSIEGRAPHATKLEIRQGERILRIVIPKKEKWTSAIDALQFGMGEVTLSVRAVYPDGSAILSAPLKIRVTAPHQLKRQNYSGKGQKGWKATVVDAHDTVHHRIVEIKDGHLRLIKALDNKSIQRDFRELKLAGYLKINESGFYQLNIKSSGTLSLSVDNSNFLEAVELNAGKLIYIPTNLEKGWHKITLTIKSPNVPKLNIALSGTTVATPISAFNLQHLPGQSSMITSQQAK